MSDQENGVASNTKNSLLPRVNIVSTTDANPVVVQTNVPHGMSDGDPVSIYDHQVNFAANGVWEIAVGGVIDATHFSIPTPGSGAGNGGATGRVQPLPLGSTYAAPSDGDGIVAESVDVAFDTLADRTTFLGTTTGLYKLAGSYRTSFSVDSSANCFAPPWDNFPTPLVAGVAAYVDLAGATVWTAATLKTMVGDVVLIDVDINTWFSNGAGADLPLNLTLWVSDVAPGAADNYVLVAGSGRHVRVYGNTTGFPIAFVHLTGTWPVSRSGNSLKLKIRANTTQANIAAGGAALNLTGDYSVSLIALRPTGMPQ
jgi:hypothetical protein